MKAITAVVLELAGLAALAYAGWIGPRWLQAALIGGAFVVVAQWVEK